MRKRLFFAALFTFIALAGIRVLLVFLRTTVIVDDKTYYDYFFYKPTVTEVLNSFKISISSQDIVSPDLSHKIQWGQNIRIVRVTEKSEPKSETIDFILEWKRRTNKNLRMVEIQHGYSQTTTWTKRSILHDGKEVTAITLDKKVKKAPQNRLILFKPSGYPQKNYDLSKYKKVNLVATAYWVGDPQVPGTITFSGHKVERGLVAVDPKVIPLGYRLYIPGYGYAYSSDTGSAIKGNRIDLFVENKKASLKWEYKRVPVYILEKAKHW